MLSYEIKPEEKKTTNHFICLQGCIQVFGLKFPADFKENPKANELCSSTSV